MHATLLIKDKIQNAIEKKQYSCGIFLDFSKVWKAVTAKSRLSIIYVPQLQKHMLEYLGGTNLYPTIKIKSFWFE